MKNPDLAILGLIMEQPRYGYEIEGVIDERNMRNWTEIGFSSIYYVLNRLEKNGYVTAQLQDSAGSGPARKVYERTEKGRSAWHEATLNALSNPEKCNQAFFLGLVGLTAVPKELVLQSLDQYRQQLQVRHDQASARQLEIGDDSSFVIDAMFDYSLNLIDAEIEWIEAFRQRLAGMDAADFND